MKALYFCGLGAFCAGLLLVSCQKDNLIESGDLRSSTPDLYTQVRSESPCGTPVVSELVFTTGANAGSVFGTATAQNDDSTVCLTIVADEGFVFDEAFIQIGDCAGIPTDPDGNFDYAMFNYNTGAVGPTDSFTLTVDRQDLPFEDGQCFCIAIAIMVNGELVWAAGDHQAGEALEGLAFDYCLQECCYEDEGGWSEGERYVERGNWATYTEYPGAATDVILFAGRTQEAGIVSFSDIIGDEVSITITLNPGWQFEAVPGNIKIQGYDEIPPAHNPAPGQFEYHFDAMESPYTVTVGVAQFYGIHVDLLHQVDCPE